MRLFLARTRRGCTLTRTTIRNALIFGFFQLQYLAHEKRITTMPDPRRLVEINLSTGDPLDQFWQTIHDHERGQEGRKNQCVVKIQLIGSGTIKTEGIPTYPGLHIESLGTFYAGDKPVLQLQDKATKDLFIVPDWAVDAGGGSGHSVWYNHGFRLSGIRLEGNSQGQEVGSEPRNIISNFNGGFGMYVDHCFFRNATGVGFLQKRTPLNVYLTYNDYAMCRGGAVHLDCYNYANGGFTMQYGQIDNCGAYPIQIDHGKIGAPIHSAAQYTIADYKFESQTKELAGDDVHEFPLLKSFVRVANAAPETTPVINLERLTGSCYLGNGDDIVADSFIYDSTPVGTRRPIVQARSITGRGRQFYTGIYNSVHGEVFTTEPNTPKFTMWCFDRTFGLDDTTVDPPVDPPTTKLPDTLAISGGGNSRIYEAVE